MTVERDVMEYDVVVVGADLWRCDRARGARREGGGARRRKEAEEAETRQRRVQGAAALTQGVRKYYFNFYRTPCGMEV